MLGVFEEAIMLICLACYLLDINKLFGASVGLVAV
jgi:hypothetical protein